MRNQKGLTILELMIVGIIIGILAGVAIPSYLTYLKRARQVEAPGALSEIQRLQGMYFAFSGNYGTLEEIGYNSSPQLRYFTVTLELLPAGDSNPMQFIATARGDVDSDGEDDVWIITEEGTPQHVDVD